VRYFVGGYVARKRIIAKDLGKILKSHGIPISTWGKGSSKTLKRLEEASDVGEVRIHLMPVMWCKKVKIDIYCTVGGVLYYLVEELQTLENGETRSRPSTRSVSEKRKKGEKVWRAARRALEEELGLTFTKKTKPEFYIYSSYESPAHLSLSFPAMYIEGPRDRLVCELDPSLFQEDGYQEWREGKLYGSFKWHPAHEVFDMLR
jgi:hypothetical protein